MINVPGYSVGGVLFTKEQIAEKVKELGAQISKDYEGEEILCVGILKGSIVFMADLIRAIEGQVKIDFMIASSYGGNTESSGTVEIKKDLSQSPKGKNILIIEDIIDSGNTLSYLKNFYFKGKDVKSLKIVTLLDKPARRKADISPDYCGFEVDDRFIIGYGLDYDEHYRELPHISYLVPDEK